MNREKELKKEVVAARKEFKLEINRIAAEVARSEGQWRMIGGWVYEDDLIKIEYLDGKVDITHRIANSDNDPLDGEWVEHLFSLYARPFRRRIKEAKVKLNKEIAIYALN